MRGVSLKFIRDWLDYYDDSIYKTLSSAEILDKCNIKLSEIQNNVLPWDQFIPLLERMAECVAPPYAFKDLIQGSVIAGNSDVIYKNSLGLITSPKMLMRLQSTLVSPRVFKGMCSMQTYPSTDRFKLQIMAPVDFPDCTLFFEGCRDGIIVTPRLIGSGDNTLVYSEISPHRFTAEYIFPKSNTIFSKVRRLFFIPKKEEFVRNLDDQLKDFEERSRTIQLESDKLQTLLIKQQKMALLGEMTTTISHEINNPLTVISSHLQEILRNLEKIDQDAGEVENRVRIALSSCWQISKIVDSIFGYNRHQAKVERFGVSDLLEDVERLCTPKCSRAQVELKVQYVDKNLKIFAIRHEIIQVLCNLVLNSINACEGIKHSLVEISCIPRPSNHTVEIHITDNGVGVKSEEKEHIFKAFTTNREEGTGLGLSLSKMLVENNKGLLSVKNLSKPTVFLVQLPQ